MDKKFSKRTQADSWIDGRLTLYSTEMELEVIWSFSLLIWHGQMDCISVIHGVEEGYLLGWSEAANPILSESMVDTNEVGDLVPFSAMERFGDEDLSDWFEIDPSIVSFNFLGYGCKGFLLGLGGGISIGFMVPSHPDEPRTTWNGKVKLHKYMKYGKLTIKPRKIEFIEIRSLMPRPNRIYNPHVFYVRLIQKWNEALTLEKNFWAWLRIWTAVLVPICSASKLETTSTTYQRKKDTIKIYYLHLAQITFYLAPTTTIQLQGLKKHLVLVLSPFFPLFCYCVRLPNL